MDNEITNKPGIWHSPKKNPKINENSITGNFWRIEKSDGKCKFYYDTGAHGGKVSVFDVPTNIFEGIKNGKLTPRKVIDKYLK